MPGLATKLPEGWERSETTSGIPYYINHESETTQWDHPEMVKLMEGIDGLNNIKYAAYRTAMKLRAIQKNTQMYMIDLPVIVATLSEEGLQDGYEDTALSAAEVLKIITSLFVNQNGDRTGYLDVYFSSELVFNWLLNVYDPGRTGIVHSLSMKIGLASMCSANLQDKYRYLFRQLATKQGNLDRKRLKLFLQECLQIPKYIYESTSFSGTSVEPAVRNCFERVNSDRIMLEEFLDWMIAEPQTIVWLPTLHRLAVSETVKHEAKCNVCKVYPVVGFRYRCLKCFNFDLCQECFWSGRVSKHHKIGHPTQEYCLASTQKEDMKDFAKVVKNKVRNKKKKEEQMRNPSKGRYIPIAAEDAPASSDEEYAVDGPPVRFAAETHAKLGNYAARLADYEDGDERSRGPTPRSRPLMDDEHQLIQHYAAHLSGDPVPSSPSPIQALREADQEHRRELEGLISSLENDNSVLQNEIQRVHAHQQQLQMQQSKEVLVMEDSAESDYLRQQGERLCAKEEVLEEHNRQLQIQLHRLRALLQQDEQTLSQLLQDEDRISKLFANDTPMQTYIETDNKTKMGGAPSSPVLSRSLPSTHTSSGLPTSFDRSGATPSTNHILPSSGYETSPDKSVNFTPSITPARGDVSQHSGTKTAASVVTPTIPSAEQTAATLPSSRHGAPPPPYPPYAQGPPGSLAHRTNTTNPLMIRATTAPLNGVRSQPLAGLSHMELYPTGPASCLEESELQDIVERMTSAFPLDVGSEMPVEIHNDLFVAAGMIGEGMQSMVTAVSRHRGRRRGSLGSASACGRDSMTEEEVELFQDNEIFPSVVSTSCSHVNDYSNQSSSAYGQEYGPI